MIQHLIRSVWLHGIFLQQFSAENEFIPHGIQKKVLILPISSNISKLWHFGVIKYICSIFGMIQYICNIWYWQSCAQMYCSHCPWGATSLMDSHIDSISENGKSANICKNMMRPEYQKYFYGIWEQHFGFKWNFLELITRNLLLIKLTFQATFG